MARTEPLLVRISGDSSELVKALNASENELREFEQAGKKVEILSAAIQSAKDARAAMIEARNAAKLFDEQLAAAKGAGAGKEAIKLLEAAVRDANREVRDLEKAWDASRAKLDVARSAAAAAGVDTRNLASEQGRLKSELETATQAVQRNTQALAAGSSENKASARSAVESVRAASAEADQLSEKVVRHTRSIGEQLGELKALYAAWISVQAGASAVSGIAATADAYTNLTAKVKMAVGEGEAFNTTLKGIEEIALNTNASLDATATLFTKLADAGQKIGVGQADALRLTETVNQAIALSGASAQASEAALTQLIQGLQGGVLRGDEFNSVMEQSPRLAKALADGLGVTTGELRKMAEAGELSSETVIRALQGQARAIETEFGKLPPTIGRAITNLQTQWQIWIGNLDQSSGSSAQVAAGIAAIANNFDLLAASLINAGQAYLGWKAYNIAAEMLGLKVAVAATTAATAADTAATAANTVAKAANTAAVSANTAAAGANATARSSVSAYMLTSTAATTADTAAKAANTTATAALAARNEAAAAAAARLSGAMSLLKGFGLAFLVTNLKDIGEWLGTAAAKAMGYGKAMEEAQTRTRAAEKAAKDAAAADAELAQQKQLAADKALGLSEQAKKLVADFGSMTKAGDGAAAALEKIGKDLDLSNIKGIADAGAALDALAQRGKISADQVQDAWEGALKGIDLQAFEVNARAAFDESEQGARRLAAAAASTEAAAKAVLDRWVELGNAGLVTGDRLAQGLAKAKDRFDELKPGINSLAEAFEALGLKSREALQEAEASAREAFEYIKSNGGTLAELQAAWEKYGAAARAANGGILPDVLRLQQEMYKVGEAGEKAAEKIGDAWDKASDRLGDYSAAANRAGGDWSRDASGNVVSVGSDVNGLAAKYTSSPEQAAEFKNLFSFFYDQASQRAENSSLTQGRQYAAIERQAAEAAAAEAARRIALSNRSAASSTTASSGAAGGTANGGVGVGNIRVNRYQIDLRTNKGVETVMVNDQSSAEALVRALQVAHAAKS